MADYLKTKSRIPKNWEFRDKRKDPKQIENTGIWRHDLTKHGAYSFLKHGSIKCKNCVLFRLKDSHCPCYGKTIEHNGKEITVTPETECPIIDNYTDNIINEIMALPYIKSQDIYTVQQLARTQGFLLIANTYLNEIGAFKLSKDQKTIDTQPLQKEIIRYENLVTKLSDQLGLTPKSRAALNLKDRTPPLSGLINEVMGEENDND